MFQERIYPYLLVFFQLSSLVYLLSSAPFLTTGYAGILIESVGAFTGLLAIYTMRIGNFNITPRNKKNGQLVTKGIYGVIRHPMYFAQLLFLLPLLIDYYNLTRLIVFCVLMITLLLKIQFEETHLVTHFKGYAAYQEKTKKIFPFIY